MMRSQLWWYLARSSGLVAAVLLTLSLIWGILLSTRILRPVDRPAWLLGVHRWLGALSCIATAIHLVALVADNYVSFGPAELLVPMASPWKRGPVAIGVIAMYLLILVQTTSLMMKRLPKRLWRTVHSCSYLSVFLVALHSGLAGTDTSNPAYLVAAFVLIASATIATILRVLNGRSGNRQSTKPSASAMPDAF